MEENMERRKHVLTDEDLNIIVKHLLEDENIDRFAAKFEERWRNYFYRGLGKGLWGMASRGILLLLFGLAAYGMGKGWKPW